MEEYREEERRVRNLIRNAKRKFERRIADGAGKYGIAKRQFFEYYIFQAANKDKTVHWPSQGCHREHRQRRHGDGQHLQRVLCSVFMREDVIAIPEQADPYRGELLGHVTITTKNVRDKS